MEETAQPNVDTQQNVDIRPQLKRQAGSFALYMKKNYNDFRNLPNKDRLKAISEKYKAEKSKQQ